MNKKELKLIRIIFITAALWNLTGAIFGFFNPAITFHTLFDRDLTDPLFHSIYQGAWGVTLMFFIGYSIVAYNPIKHTGIVLIGEIGKTGFVISLLKLYLSGFAQSIVFVIIVGDVIFIILFVYYFYVLHKAKEKIL